MAEMKLQTGIYESMAS